MTSGRKAVPIRQPGQWQPETNPMPVPDCSVVTHSNVLMTPTTLTLEMSQGENQAESTSLCNDKDLLEQV